MKREMDMLHGSLHDKIIRFAIPLAVTGILQQLFNAADIAVVGQFAGKNAMAAVGSNTPVIALLLNLFVGISLGANVVISNLTGKMDTERIHKAVHTTILVALLSGVLVGVIGEMIAVPLLHAMSVPDKVFDMAVLYLRIYFAGMPVILLYNFESAIFRSQGDTQTPLFCLVVSGVMNVLLNLFFVCILHMTVNGVALATVISNLVSSFLLFYFLMTKDTVVRVRFQELRIDTGILLSMLKIGVPAGIQGMVFSFSNIIIQSAINSLGSDVMAASAAAFNVEIFVYYIINSFGQACTTFVGQNYGARQYERCRKITGICLLQDLVITVVVSAVILALGGRLLSIFNGDPVIIKYGLVRIRYILLAEGVNVIIEVLSGCMRGYAYSLVPALLTFAGVCGVRITWVYTLFRAHQSFPVLMAVYPVSWCVTAAAIAVAYFVVRKRLKQQTL